MGAKIGQTQAITRQVTELQIREIVFRIREMNGNPAIRYQMAPSKTGFGRSTHFYFPPNRFNCLTAIEYILGDVRLPAPFFPSDASMTQFVTNARPYASLWSSCQEALGGAKEFTNPNPEIL